jgi:hypothetical protein
MDEGKGHSSGWRRLRVLVGLAVMMFAVTLAVIVGSRLSDEALAVLAGAACGVGAAIPTSLLVIAVSRRRDEPRVQQAVSQGPYPPVIVVTPPGGQQRPGGWNALPSSLSAPVERHFTVVGGAAADAEVVR